MKNEDAYTAKEAAIEIGLSEVVIIRMLNNGILKGTKNREMAEKDKPIFLPFLCFC